VADVLALDRLDDDEERILKEILNRISSHRGFNADRARWYEASRKIRSLGASSVRRLSGVETVAGWPGLVVDALEERLNIVGPVVPGATDTELDAIWADNSLEADYSPAHLEALIHGVAFLTASRGGQMIKPVFDMGLDGPANLQEFFTSKYRDLPLGPRFGLGHGLSYTTFEYSGAALSRTTISLAELDAGEEVEVGATGGRAPGPGGMPRYGWS